MVYGTTKSSVRNPQFACTSISQIRTGFLIQISRGALPESGRYGVFISEAAIRQGPQICWGIASTDGLCADLACPFEHSSRPDLAPPRDRQVPAKSADRSSRACLAA